MKSWMEIPEPVYGQTAAESHAAELVWIQKRQSAALRTAQPAFSTALLAKPTSQGMLLCIRK